MNKKIAIIGGGNLGTAIAEGLIQSGFIQPKHIIITKRNIATLSHLKKQGVLVSDDNEEALRFADLIILAVKPFQVNDILTKLKGAMDVKRHVIVSVMTGVSTDDILEILSKKIPVVRAMPNTAIAIQESMTCISNRGVQKKDMDFIMELFTKLGRVAVIEEKLMEAATVLGACGTAYAMRYIRANIQGGY